LSDANQHDFFFAFLSRGLQKRTRDVLLVLSLLESHHGNAVGFGELMDGLDISLANLAKACRRRDLELALPAEEGADLAD